MTNKNPIIIEGASLFYKNFSGKETDCNAAGNRNFCVEIDPELAERLRADGWTVKQKYRTHPSVRDEQEIPVDFIKIVVSYKYRAPRIVAIKGRSRQNLDESNVELLDWARTTNVDIKICPHKWSFGGNSGYNGYLDSLYATIEEDDLEKKYAYLNEYDEADDEELPFN